jgi:ATP-dependent helicase/nuclease subunit A
MTTSQATRGATLPELFVMQKPVPSGVPDVEERELALDVQRSWIVEAPAGSGKTGLLIQRFLKLLASDNVTEPNQVLAITFTRKATSEMRERVLHQLSDASDGTEPENAFDESTRPLAEAVLTRDRQFGWGLLDNPRRLNIRTIDSVCVDIARELPILSGSGGGQKPEEDSGRLHAEAARRTLMQLGEDDAELSTALETLLLHRDGSLGECQRLIAEMLAMRDQWGELVPLTSEHLTEEYLEGTVLPKLQKALDQAICRGLTRLTQLLSKSALATLCTLAEEMAHAEGYQGAPSPIAICKGRYTSPSDKTEDLDHWRALIHLLVRPSKPRDWRKAVSGNIVRFEILKHHQAELKFIIAQIADTPGLLEELCEIDSLPPAEYPPEQWHVTKALFRVLSRALVELQLVFAEEGACDFAEIGLLAKSALRRETAIEDLNVSSGMNLQHLLVDEMQDTSSSQYELIQLLTQRWDGHSQTVFLVGDPKQSIYLFRQARVERFVRTMQLERLGDVPLGTLHLSANFRSQRDLVTSFNDDFSKLFPSESNPLHPELVPFRGATPIRGNTATAARTWHVTAIPYSGVSEESTSMQSRRDAQEVRRIVEQWRTKTPPERDEPWKIAVLVRSRSHLLEIVKAFRESRDGHAIPFRAVEIEPLSERQEILDLVALTRALLHPADRTAWLAVLRAPWCGLGLADLHTLVGQDNSSFARRNIVDLIRERGELLSEDGIARLQPVWTVMSAALEQRGRLSTSRWVERTWRAFGADSFMDAEQQANVSRFLRLLDELEETMGELEPGLLKQRLNKLYAAPSVHPGAVDLMTIHGSKGLEWDVVIVPALEKTGRTTTGRLLSWLELDGGNELTSEDVAHGIIAPIQGKGEDSKALNKWMRTIESARESAERKRLFYVACTRAREELHLFAAPARIKSGEIKPKSDSLLASAWPAVEDRFTTENVSDAPVIVMPMRQGPMVLESLAAAAEPVVRRVIQRIPQHFMPVIPADTSEIETGPAHFERPEGSFEARAFGNAMHAFLDVLANRFASGADAESLLAELPTWVGRVDAVLRGSGLSPTVVKRLAANVLKGLTNTLTHDDGLWVLASHANGASEASVVTWAEQAVTHRLDRTFLGGPTPGEPGTSHLWIVDYKTAAYAGEGVEGFLFKEQAKYQQQLEAYARDLRPAGGAVRLALYYPMVPALRWWEPLNDS